MTIRFPLIRRLAVLGGLVLAVLAAPITRADDASTKSEDEIYRLAPPLWQPHKTPVDEPGQPPIWVLDKERYNAWLMDHGSSPLGPNCPTSFTARWKASSGQDPDMGLGDVIFRQNGLSVWKKHDPILFDRIDDTRATAVLKMQSPFTGNKGNNAKEGPYVVIKYPYLTIPGGGAMCQMALYTCPSADDVNEFFKQIGSTGNCIQHKYYISSSYD